MPDFVEASLAKIINLRKKLSAASAPIRGLFGGAGADQGEVLDKLDGLMVSGLRGF